MFERRLQIVLGLFGLAILVIIVRLFDLQVVHAVDYAERAERSLVLEPQSLSFIRGSLIDCRGKVLVSDRPCWELAVDYRVLVADQTRDPEELTKEAKRWRRALNLPRSIPAEELVADYRARVDRMWVDLSRFVRAEGSRTAVDDLRQKARRIHERVSAIRAIVSQRRGFDSPVAEERVKHALITNLNGSEQIQAREFFSSYPWVAIQDATQRAYHGDMTCMAHVLGRTGRVTAEHVANDPLVDDSFGRYEPNGRVGISGVEHLAESVLRGRRGQLTLDRTGNIVGDKIEAEHGRSVTLSIHFGLQQALYEVLERAVNDIPESCGGSIVVLDVATREVLGLVSYPSYDPASFDADYAALREDTKNLPLRFRAVANRYAPGSIIKPLICITGLSSGVINLDSRETCTGYLFPDVRDQWRCWQISGTSLRKAHGSVDVVGALTGSCNVFMYRLGERLGVDALCSAFDMVRLGRSSGIGLKEESRGVNPTPRWLMDVKQTPVYPGHARLFAIGQGEVAVTPVQAANLMATYATGRYRPVTLVKGIQGGGSLQESPEWLLPGTPEHWRAIRWGIFNVVNDPEGTAYPYAHFQRDGYALCGKTGSATAYPWPTAYRVPFSDDQGNVKEAIIAAGAKGPAIKRFQREYPDAVFDPNEVEVFNRWPTVPPAESNYAHAWFAGYLQKLNDAGGPDESIEPRVAFAVMIEFGGSGGRTSGPVAREVSDKLLDILGADLRADDESS